MDDYIASIASISTGDTALSEADKSAISTQSERAEKVAEQRRVATLRALAELDAAKRSNHLTDRVAGLLRIGVRT